jgi:hypothetical protein
MNSIIKFALCLLVIPVLASAEVIPEVLELRKNRPIPTEILDRYDSKDIAESLIEWMRLDREKPSKKKTPIYDFKKNARIVMAFNLKNLEKVRDNCFLNQHQTGTSNAYLGKGRIAQENQMLDLKVGLSEKEKEILPKYAYLFLDNAPGNMEKDNAVYDTYGGVFAQFKDEIKERSTFTGGDSLILRASPKQLMTFNYPLYKDDQIKKYEYSYWEAQIWGRLCMEDVDHFLVGCTAEFTDEQIEHVKAVTGKPVYRCEKRKLGTKIYSVKAGELL